MDHFINIYVIIHYCIKTLTLSLLKNVFVYFKHHTHKFPAKFNGHIMVFEEIPVDIQGFFVFHLYSTILQASGIQ